MYKKKLLNAFAFNNSTAICWVATITYDYSQIYDRVGVSSHRVHPLPDRSHEPGTYRLGSSRHNSY
jgi:hypothetical protein